MFTTTQLERATADGELSANDGDASTRATSTRSAGVPSQKSAATTENVGNQFVEERTGHLNLRIVLRTLVALIERCSAIRVNELVLNACDTLITTPNCASLALVDGCTRVCVRAYTHLGCPSGCAEGKS